MSMYILSHRFGDVTIQRDYHEADSIWRYPREKQIRKLMVDVVRDLLAEIETKVTERGG
jgi:hypothetical protein